MTASVPRPDSTLLVIAKQPVPGRVRLVSCRRSPMSRRPRCRPKPHYADTLTAMLMAPARRRLMGPRRRARSLAAARVRRRAAVRRDARRTPHARFCFRARPRTSDRDRHPGRSHPACSRWTGRMPTLCSARPPTADSGPLAWGSPDPALLRGVPMSTQHTGAVPAGPAPRGRIARRRPAPAARSSSTTAADAVAVAGQAPGSRFAARAREFAAIVSPGLRRDARQHARGKGMRPGAIALYEEALRGQAAPLTLCTADGRVGEVSPVVRTPRRRGRGTAQALSRGRSWMWAVALGGSPIALVDGVCRGAPAWTCPGRCRLWVRPSSGARLLHRSVF